MTSLHSTPFSPAYSLRGTSALGVTGFTTPRPCKIVASKDAVREYASDYKKEKVKANPPDYNRFLIVRKITYILNLPTHFLNRVLNSSIHSQVVEECLIPTKSDASTHRFDRFYKASQKRKQDIKRTIRDSFINDRNNFHQKASKFGHDLASN
ncbi:hypothetical protein AVEN_36911-1 [Araneus ventricosus]|uniref:Uncharacterized protein n=1 Tax=Araneus ventricosus TaxID=182803 RepID=A0A4Y2G556_ARAVE|nr:hypothetical protein AVEN_36911-1 [Araneus ventricosus]